MKGIRQFILTRGLISLFLLTTACNCVAAPYFGSAIKAKVVDGYTGQPLDGVMVVAYWRTFTPGIESGLFPNVSGHGGPDPTCVKLANLLTVTSGVDGTFKTSAWGPKSACLTMSGSQPELLLYKPGYKVLRLLNADDVFNPSENPSLESGRGA